MAGAVTRRQRGPGAVGRGPGPPPTFAHRLCIWKCKVCDYAKNEDNAERCEICGSAAPLTHFEVVVHERCYACKVKRSAAHDNGVLELVDTNPSSEFAGTVELVLESGVDLEERIQHTMETLRRNYDALILGKPVLTLTMREHSSEVEEGSRTLRGKRKARKSVARSRTPNAVGPPVAVSSPTYFDTPSLGVEEAKKEETAVKTTAVGSTLFDKVLTECRGQVYDHVLGAFLPKTHPVVTSSTAEPTNVASHSIYCGTDGDFNFVRGMVKERDAMTHKVTEEAAKRRRHSPQPEDDDDEASSSRPEKTRQEIMFLGKKGPECFMGPCTVCEREFHVTKLVGNMPFRAVARWREDHGAPLDPADQRFALTTVYNTVPVCAFCMQFFDPEYCEYVTYHRGKTKYEDPVLLLEGSREGSCLDKRITRRLQSFAKLKNKRDPLPEDERPCSRLNLQLAISSLQGKAELPLLMSDLGFELARFSLLQARTRANRHSPQTLIAPLNPSDVKRRKSGVEASERLYAVSKHKLVKLQEQGDGPYVVPVGTGGQRAAAQRRRQRQQQMQKERHKQILYLQKQRQRQQEKLRKLQAEQRRALEEQQQQQRLPDIKQHGGRSVNQMGAPVEDAGVEAEEESSDPGSGPMEITPPAHNGLAKPQSCPSSSLGLIPFQEDPKKKSRKEQRSTRDTLSQHKETDGTVETNVEPASSDCRKGFQRRLKRKLIIVRKGLADQIIKHAKKVYV